VDAADRRIEELHGESLAKATACVGLAQVEAAPGRIVDLDEVE
jgi:hypothetical protein